MATTPLYNVTWKEGKHFVSQCLNVDVASFGASREEAIENLNEAVALYFEDEPSQRHDIIEGPELASMSFEHA